MKSQIFFFFNFCFIFLLSTSLAANQKSEVIQKIKEIISQNDQENLCFKSLRDLMKNDEEKSTFDSSNFHFHILLNFN